MDDEHRNAHKIIILSAVFDSSRMLIGAIHSLFLLQRGVSLPDLALLQIVYSVSALVFEFPTGIYAVKFGNRASLILSCLFTSSFYLAALAAPNLLLLSISEIFYALGLAFSSGALESWWISEVPSSARSGLIIQRFTYLKTEMTSFGNVFMGLIGSIVATYAANGFVLVYAASTLVMVALMFAFSRQHESRKSDNKEQGVLSKTYLVNTLLHSFRSRFATFFLAISCMLTAAVQLIYHYWQPYFSELAADSSTFKELFSSEAMLLGTVFASYASLKYFITRYVRTQLLHVFDPISVGFFFSFLAALFIAIVPLLAQYQILLGIAGFAAFHSCLSVTSNVASARFYKSLQDYNSAAIISGVTLLTRIVGIIGLLFISAAVSRIPLELLFSLLAVPFLLISLLFTLWRRSPDDTRKLYLQSGPSVPQK